MTTGGSRGGRGLQTDPARPDDRHPLRRGERRLHCVAVGDPAQVMHPGQIGTGHLQAPGRRTGRQQQLVVAERLAPRCAHFVCGAVDFGDPCPQTQVDVVFGVPLRGMDVDLLPLGDAQEVALRQGRSVIGAVGLIADEDDLPSKPLVRSASAALAPASPAPTMTNVCSVRPCRVLLVEWTHVSRAAQPNPVAVLALRRVVLSSALRRPPGIARPAGTGARSPPGRSLLRQLVGLGAQGDQQIGERLVEAGDALVFEGAADIVHVDPHRAQVLHDAGGRARSVSMVRATVP